MITVLALTFSVCSLNAEESKAKIAMVDLDQIKNLLLDRAFEKSGDTSLKERYEANEKRQEDAEMKIQKAAMSGKGFNPMDFAKDMVPTNMNERKKISSMIDEELILVINELYPEEYTLILKKSYGNNVLYTSVVISDITQNIKQHLVIKKNKLKASQE